MPTSPQAELEQLEAQRAAPTPPRIHRVYVGGDEEREVTPDLVSFDSKEDFLCEEEDGEGVRFTPAGSASEGEDLPMMSDTPL